MTHDEYRKTLDQLGLTQAQAAELLGISLRTSHGYANGDPIPLSIELALELIALKSNGGKCRRGVQRDNCPTCEGTGWQINFRAIRERANTVVPTKKPKTFCGPAWRKSPPNEPL